MKLSESRIKEIIAEEMISLEKEEKYFNHVDKEGGMAKRQLYNIATYAMQIHDSLEDADQLESWVQNKITIASDYIGKVKHYLEYEMGIKPEDTGGCAPPQGQPAEPSMVVDGEETYEIHEEFDT
jgi:hypothetical protein